MKEKPPRETLWAPWRREYILAPKSEGCIFCERLEEADGPGNLILFRGHECFIIMNRYPYNSGHLMVVPMRHIAELEGLEDAESLELMQLVRLSTSVLKKIMTPNGFNIGINMGAVSGAGVADHLHIHVIPRWKGDTNFMPVIGNTRIISEALEKTYDKLKLEFDRRPGETG